MAKLVDTFSKSTLEVTISTPAGSILVDADAIPTIKVFNTADDSVKYEFDSGSIPPITHAGVGKYEITWASDEAGEFEIVWYFSVSDNDQTSSDEIVVYDVGAGPMLGTQTEADIAAYVRRNLGSDVVGVELTADQIDDAIVDAKLWFSSIIGQMKYKEITIPSDGGSVPYTDIASDCQNVVEVAFNVNNSDLFDQFDWAGVEMGPMAFGMYGGYSSGGYGSGGGYSYLVQSMQYREQAKRILSSDRDWQWDYASRSLRLSPTTGNLGSKAAVWYLSGSLNLSDLQTYEYWLVRKWALSESMLILGQIRSKYADLPSATGSITLNGDALKSEGEALKADLMERAKGLRAPAGFFAG